MQHWLDYKRENSRTNSQAFISNMYKKKWSKYVQLWSERAVFTVLSACSAVVATSFFSPA